MTSLHELKAMIDDAVKNVHGSPVADQPILFNGEPVEIKIRVTKHVNGVNNVTLHVHAD
jgi:hypothetical protein